MMMDNSDNSNSNNSRSSSNSKVEEKTELELQKLSITEDGFQKEIKRGLHQIQQRRNLHGRAIITSRECATDCKKKSSKLIQKQYPIHELPKLFYAQPPKDVNFDLLPELDLNHYLPVIGDYLVVKILKVSPWRLTTLTKLDLTTGRLRLEFHRVRKSVTFEIKDLFEIRRLIV